MNSKNFKKVLSTSIASLTVLSTLSGSVSTKIYADGGDSIISGAETQNKGNFGFIINKIKYPVSFSEDDYKKTCEECEKTGTSVKLSYEGFLKILEATESKINAGQEDETPNGETVSFATSCGNLRGFVRYFSEERTEEEYLKATMQFLKRGIEEGNGTRPTTVEYTNQEDTYDFNNVVEQEVVQGDNVNNLEEQTKTETNGEVSNNIIAPAEVDNIEETEGKTGSNDTDQKSEEKTNSDNKDQQTAGADEKTEPAPDEAKQEETGSDNNNQPSTKTDGAEQIPAGSQPSTKAEEEEEADSAQQPATQPANNIGKGIKGSIFKRAFNAIKGFFSNIFNFVRGLFHIG